MGERLLCKQEVIGSIPFTSTNLRRELGEGGIKAESLYPRILEGYLDTG